MADPLSVRLATADDARFVWEVNNEASVRAQSINTDAIPWDMHEAWFAASLTNPDRVLLIAIADDERVGTVRFDINGPDATISVALAPHARGHGYGVATICEGCALIAEHGVEEVEALIRPDNGASRAAFTRAGFDDTTTRVVRGDVELDRFIWRPEAERSEAQLTT